MLWRSRGSVGRIVGTAGWRARTCGCGGTDPRGSSARKTATPTGRCGGGASIGGDRRTLIGHMIKRTVVANRLPSSKQSRRRPMDARSDDCRWWPVTRSSTLIGSAVVAGWPGVIGGVRGGASWAGVLNFGKSLRGVHCEHQPRGDFDYGIGGQVVVAARSEPGPGPMRIPRGWCP